MLRLAGTRACEAVSFVLSQYGLAMSREGRVTGITGSRHGIAGLVLLVALHAKPVRGEVAEITLSR